MSIVVDRADLAHPPRRLPWAGDLWGLNPNRLIQSILARGTGLGPLFELKIFRQRWVFVTDTELIAELCDEGRFTKALPPGLVLLRDLVGDGLFTAYNEEPNWALAHELLLPAFSRGAMRSYHDIMLSVARELVATWAEKGENVDVGDALTRTTLETISRAAFGRDFGSFRNNDQHPFVAAMIGALRASQQQILVEALPLGRAPAWLMRRRNDSRRRYLGTLLDDIISERRRSGQPDQDADDLLEIMLNTRHPESGAGLDDRNIRFQILTFLAAGHETTSAALSFALWFVSQDADVLAKAQSELDAVLGTDPDAEPSFEQVAKLRYVRRIVDESLRLWPTAPGFARTARHDTTLGGRWPMRAGEWVLVLTQPLHRDPAIWGTSSDKFDPDNFESTRVKARPPRTYLPFGVGDRACIGRQFALHEAVLVLAAILRRFDVSAPPGARLEVEERLTLLPHDLRLSFRPRSERAS